MFQKHRIAIVLVTAVLLLFLLFWGGSALAGGGFTIPWWTVDGGGGLSQGGAFAVNGTVGQPDAGSMSGGQYTLNSGFWALSSSDNLVFLPLVVR